MIGHEHLITKWILSSNFNLSRNMISDMVEELKIFKSILDYVEIMNLVLRKVGWDFVIRNRTIITIRGKQNWRLMKIFATAQKDS